MTQPPLSKEKMTAWQRWELADFDGNPSRAAKAAAVPQPEATAASQAPSPEQMEPQFDIKLPTLEEIEQIHAQAQKDGYTAGYEEGTARVRMEAMRISSLADGLEAALANVEKDVAEEILALALEVARQVVGQQIMARPEVILSTVKEALLQLPHQHASIFLNPEDATLVRSYLGDQLGHAGHRFFEEPTMERGSCRVEAAGSQIDATVGTRWRRVIEAMGMRGEWIEQIEEAP